MELRKLRSDESQLDVYVYIAHIYVLSGIASGTATTSYGITLGSSSNDEFSLLRGSERVGVRVLLLRHFTWTEY